jgi:hypothetical protein
MRREMMSVEFKNEPDKDIKVHKKQVLKLLCKEFASHETGLPEWVKNASDEYCRRREITEDQRVVILIFRNGRGDRPGQIACLDFSGMTSGVINEHFRHWASPDAATQGSDSGQIQGGHGNGGKCYMSHMFDYSYLETVKDGLGNKYGVEGGSQQFGYMPSAKRGCDCKVADVEAALDLAMEPLGLGVGDLPDDAIQAVRKNQGFTLFCGLGPKDLTSRIPATKLIEQVKQHPQMAQSIEICKVYAIANGKPVDDWRPLQLQTITPRKNWEKPVSIPMPDVLKDPVSGEKVETLADKNSFLTLQTSQRSMHWKMKPRHNVTYKCRKGHIGYKEVSAFDVPCSHSQYIYGDCRMDSLLEYISNDRYHLTNSAVTRAVEGFISSKIEEYARKLEEEEKKKYGKAAKNAVSEMNAFMNRWKNKLLKKMMIGIGGSGGQQGTGGSSQPLPAGKCRHIEINMPYARAGIGVVFRPLLRFYDGNGAQIRTVPYRWVSEDPNVALVDDELNILNTFRCGRTFIHAETDDGKVKSDKMKLTVENIKAISIEPCVLEVSAGGRSSLSATCTFANGSIGSDVCLTWAEENTSIARVSATGSVFGASIGETTVIAGDDKCECTQPAQIRVVEPTKAGKTGSGSGYPQILVSGEFDRDPDTQEYRFFGNDEPPTLQSAEDFDRNIWWINSNAPLAQLFLDKKEDYGHASREWRVYLLERYVDIMIQIAVRADDEVPDNLTTAEWTQHWGFQAAKIQQAATDDLRLFLEKGKQAEE